ncbi:hypothetical protein [Pyrobaculum aerophilum]|uniref:Uncharacterized protein n=1 Tax=Pyrobaculum aerophilum TaxID=13773 RepID=A0A371R0Y6_9CREN|nr:hypothetical protein [Pyrobaculum aerophilum]RFA97125.1 hypothetical protein CGL52_10065 [Pyrobaculum aerophilum]RFA98079.1 hypothetical protein CGL51_01710 [Pyrobaculum aerophilum]
MLPREKSVLGILTFSYLLAVATSLPPQSLLGAVLFTVAYATHLLTFDPIFYGRKWSRIIALLGINTAPYLISMAFDRGDFVVYGAGALLLAAYLWLMRIGLGRSVQGVIIGTALLSYTFIIGKAMLMHSIALKDVALALFFIGYHVSTAYYVESRLAFRKVSPLWSSAAWLLTLATTLPLWWALVIPALEPSVKFLLNTVKNVKVSRHEDIVKMGWRELARSALLTALLGAAYYLA